MALPMIVHVINRAKESKVGDVFVATPDKKYLMLLKKMEVKAILTKNDHFHQAVIEFMRHI